MNKVVKNTLYNLIGSFVYLFSQWIMSILVVRLSGSYEEAGVFGTALSVSNVFFMISTFSIRNYQVADVNDKFTNSEYITFRIITCVVSMLFLPVYLVIMRYSVYISLSVMCYMIIKLAEAIIDVIHGIFQKEWRLDIAFKSFVIRGILNLIVFSFAEWILKNLVLSLLLTAIVSLICAVAIDIRYCRAIFEVHIDFKNYRLFNLLCCCMPMFIHGFLSTLIYNIPRIMAQKMCGEELFGFYSSVAAPTVVVQLVVCNIFSPCITIMSEQFAKKEKKLFKTIAGIQGIIIIIGSAAVGGFALLGNYFLEIMFGKEILEYESLLIPAVAAAALIATTAFVSSIFTVCNHNVIMAVLEGVTFVIDLILSIFFIKTFGLQGINYALIVSCIVFIAIGYFIVIPNITKDYKRVYSE